MSIIMAIDKWCNLLLSAGNALDSYVVNSSNAKMVLDELLNAF